MEPLRLASLWSRALAGAKAIPVAVEVHLGNGLPQFQIVGLPDLEVRESRERVRVALLASGFEFPQRRITVNLAPADLPKESGRFDLPIALGILIAAGQLPRPADPRLEFAGELALNGALRPVRGALSMGLAAMREGRLLVLPEASAAELRLFRRSGCLGVASLPALADRLRRNDWQVGPEDPSVATEGAPPAGGMACGQASPGTLAELPDLQDVIGMMEARQALVTAAAGGHSLLLHGPPGCGKTMLAERLIGLLPPFSEEEALEYATQRSLAGLPLDPHRLYQRPCRRPHHTTPALALTGGGAAPIRPGEISLAHGGVLFLDEMPEFSRSGLEALREPLESGEIHVSRVHSSVTLPARFQLLGTMNPCPCGRPEGAQPPCQCSPERIRAYRARISLPVLDRIDLWVAVRPPGPDRDRDPQAAQGHPPESTAQAARRVLRARQRQIGRQGCINALLSGPAALRHAMLSDALHAHWQAHVQAHRLSPRGAYRLLRVAMTLADLMDIHPLQACHLDAAASWRAPF